MYKQEATQSVGKDSLTSNKVYKIPCELFCSFCFKHSIGMVKMIMGRQQLVRKQWDWTQKRLPYLGGTQELSKWVWEPSSFLNFKAYRLLRRHCSPHQLMGKEDTVQSRLQLLVFLFSCYPSWKSTSSGKNCPCGGVTALQRAQRSSHNEETISLPLTFFSFLSLSLWTVAGTVRRSHSAHANFDISVMSACHHQLLI